MNYNDLGIKEELLSRHIIRDGVQEEDLHTNVLFNTFLSVED